MSPRLRLILGRVSQPSKPAQFDAAGQIIRGAGLDVHHLTVKHDVLVDEGKPFFERFTPEAPAPEDAASG